jgi:hypothetical protein
MNILSSKIVDIQTRSATDCRNTTQTQVAILGIVLTHAIHRLLEHFGCQCRIIGMSTNQKDWCLGSIAREIAYQAHPIIDTRRSDIGQAESNDIDAVASQKESVPK